MFRLQENKYDDEDQEFKIKSKTGYLVLHHSKSLLYIKFSALKLSSNSTNFKTQGEYVIFYYHYLELELDIEEIVENCQVYDFLDIKPMKRVAIVLHRKYIYINKLCF